MEQVLKDLVMQAGPVGATVVLGLIGAGVAYQFAKKMIAKVGPPSAEGNRFIGRSGSPFEMFPNSVDALNVTMGKTNKLLEQLNTHFTNEVNARRNDEQKAEIAKMIKEALDK